MPTLREPHRDAPEGFFPHETAIREDAFSSTGPYAHTFLVEKSNEVFVCKRLGPRAIREPAAAEGIAREGEILAKLAGRGAPKLVAQGADARGPYLVLERVLAPTVATSVREDPRAFVMKDALRDAAMAAFGALAEVHDAKDESGALAVIHGDVSPSNVAVARDASRATLLDFGLASFRDARRSTDGTFRGTVAYAAPEVARGESMSARSDLFSLAASLVFAFTARAPRDGSEGAAAILARAGSEPITLPAEFGSISPLAACLEMREEDRPPSARAVVDALRSAW